MSDVPYREGRCSCAGIRFGVTGAPLLAGLCHCRLCRLWVGAPMMAGTIFPRDAVTIHRGVTRRYRSSARGTRHFCGDCGTKLFFEADDGSDRLEVVGGLETADWPAPTFEIWTEAKLPWVVLDMELTGHRRRRTDDRDWAPPRHPAPEAPERHGGCLCGDIAYVIDSAPESRCFCHCEDCRRASGAPVIAFGTVPASAYGILRGEPMCTASSPGAERTFCGRCGTTLTYRSLGLPDEIDITLATLDDPTPWAPEAHVFAASRLPWLRLDTDLPARSANHG